ncbi:hypothetical protein ASF06_07835 [Agreia sp. Leaf244]|uniref:glycosyltransferase family 87 protein n=1 Tax=Agreia sp. Leaf244 TaxID=1736305 RepID=UPI000702127D|nr:glycosyltransferase family 87 protein [Agreia sp. Leaf244]KQO10111.1 hypothetical protein ASF06_07835 [Agreia sp. Leaf244]
MATTDTAIQGLAPQGIYDRFIRPALPEPEIFEKPRNLLWGFIGIHVVYLLGLLPNIVAGTVEGDLPLYRRWAIAAESFGQWPGIHFEWVYPIGAILPIAISNIAGPQLYQLLWFVLIASLNAASIVVLSNRGRSRRGVLASWWWLGILTLLSPVALLRLEGITAPLVIIALVLIARRPIVASVLLALATWIKVWPAAIFLAIIGAFPRRRIAVATGAVFSVGVAAIVWAFGGLHYLLGFAQMQTARGLQLEAPVTTPWLWLAILNRPGSHIINNTEIATREVVGPYDHIAISLMTPAMALAVVGVLALVVWAKHRGAQTQRLLLVASLALATTVVVFNKVGSPQYMLWLAPIIAVGITHGWRAWRTPALLMVAISVLTTFVFPILYMPLIAGDPGVALLLTARNVLLVVLLGWAVRELVSLGARAAGAEPRFERRAREREQRRARLTA